MNKTAGNFMKAAVLYALAGIILGIVMAGSHDFAMGSVHAHLSLLGWTSMAICGLYYQFVPQAAEMGVAKVHFWLANAGVVVLTSSVALIVNGNAGAEVGAAIGSLALLVSMLLFGYIVFTAKEAGREKRQAAFGNNSVLAKERV
ncbi:MAG: hypothetical protein OEV28_04770 [Nitrospirota bacterium]|nr:hypothetical protein [Nitrospirota bacterium]